MKNLTKITANGVDFKINNPTQITWNADSNMNNYIEPGIYDIYGERTVKTDNLPITNDGSGHSIAARLIVVASTLQPNNTEKCITQFLQLSNRMGGEGNTYIRTYNENNNGLNGWSPWKKQQGMVESYINTDTVGITATGGQTTGLNGMTENGMYNGIYTDDYTFRSSTFVETFVLVVINDQTASSLMGNLRRISQLKYATDTMTGQCTVKKRVGTGSYSISWGDWEEIDTIDITEYLKDGRRILIDLVDMGIITEGPTYIVKPDINSWNKIRLDSYGTITDHMNLHDQYWGFQHIVKIKYIGHVFIIDYYAHVDDTYSENTNPYYYRYIMDYRERYIKVPADMTTLYNYEDR